MTKFKEGKTYPRGDAMTNDTNRQVAEIINNPIGLGEMKMKTILSATIMISLMVGCSDADVASNNLRKAAEQFEIQRRVVFFNGITDTYLLSLEGLCSIEEQQRQLEVTCKISDDEYVKHHLGLSDNVSYFSEQLRGVKVDVYHYRIIFKPAAIIPDIDYVAEQ